MEWKDIENGYQVSSMGDVRSMDRTIVCKNGVIKNLKGKMLQKNKDKDGYLFVTINKKRRSIHRLVAQAFIPNPNNFSEVNHKNEIKSDNRVDNLEWCTHSYNNKYGGKVERVLKSRKNTKVGEKEVVQYTKDGRFVAEYKSIMEAERQTNISNSSICAVCNGSIHKDGRGHEYKPKTAGGFVWKFKE